MRECHQGSWRSHATSWKPNIDLQSIDQCIRAVHQKLETLMK
jgi:hypothetical protein